MQKGGNIRKYDTKYRLEEFVLRLKKLKKYYSIIRAPIVLITGKAGIGKSHFTAHCALRHMESGGISVLILGNLLKSGQPLWLQIRQLLDLPNTDEFLNYMNTKGRETGQRSILFFDALNEADKRWEEEINGFVKKLSNYPYTGVMISLRSGVAVDKEDELRHDLNLTSVELTGFKNVDEAIKKFCDFYKVPSYVNFFYRYLFGRPLFLKLYCQSCGKVRKPNQAIYYSYIINNYIDYINIQLCNNFKISSRINVAKDLLNAFAEIILETFERDVDYEKFIKRIDTDRHILIR